MSFAKIIIFLKNSMMNLTISNDIALNNSHSPALFVIANYKKEN